MKIKVCKDFYSETWLIIKHPVCEAISAPQMRWAGYGDMYVIWLGSAKCSNVIVWRPGRGTDQQGGVWGRAGARLSFENGIKKNLFINLISGPVFID